MGNTLRDPDFVTTRGPLIDIGDGVFDIGDPVPYTMGPTIQEHYPTDGSPRTWQNECIVSVDKKDSFVRSILADVYEDTANPDNSQTLTMTPFGDPNPITYVRNPLVRLHPQQHPVHPRAFAVDAQVVAGLGYPVRASNNELTFKTIGNPEGLPGGIEPIPGYIRIAVTWRDLPFEVNIEDIQTNNPLDSEIRRYCVFKPTIKGSNLQVKGNVFFIDDVGQIIKNDASLTSNGTAASSPFTLPEPSVFPVPAATYSVTMKMVPRVPLAAQLMQGLCNQTNTIQFPDEILKGTPDVGTLQFLGYELSDPYYTVSGRKVFDITYSLGYRPSGDHPRRGWNAAYCTKKMAFRRIVVAQLAAGGPPYTLMNIETGAPIATFPITSEVTADQSNRLAPKGQNIYNFAELANLFRFEGGNGFILNSETGTSISLEDFFGGSGTDE